MVVSILLGVSALLFLLPSCVNTLPTGRFGLMGRIEVEQYQQFTKSFGRKRTWNILYYLEMNTTFAQKIARNIGFDWVRIARSLRRLRWNITVEEVLLAKLAGVVLLGVGFLVYMWLMLQGASISMLEFTPFYLAVAAFLFPTQLVEWADKRAKAEIFNQLPIFFSIVQALVEAGMPVHTAIRAASKRYEERLGFELAQLEVEEKNYGNWRKALEEMAYRWDVDAFISIVSEINEALTKGISIAGLLQTQVEEMVRIMEDQASDYVNRLSVRLLPFLIVFMGVPLLFLVLGPSFINIKANL